MGRKKIMPEIKPEEFTDNPLLGIDFKVIVTKMPDGKFKKSGEELVPSEALLEKDTSTKLYTDLANKRDVVLGLKQPSLRLLLWIVYSMDTGKDYLWINKAAFMEHFGITSINTYKTALRALVRYNFISESHVKTVYWVNPRYVFSGSRINRYPKHVELFKPKEKDSEIIKHNLKIGE